MIDRKTAGRERSRVYHASRFSVSRYSIPLYPLLLLVLTSSWELLQKVSDGEHSAAIPHPESPLDLRSSSPGLLELTLFIPPLPKDNSIWPSCSPRIHDCTDNEPRETTPDHKTGENGTRRRGMSAHERRRTECPFLGKPANSERWTPDGFPGQYD